MFECSESWLNEIEINWLWDNYWPTVSIVHNGRLYFWWWPEWAKYSNMVSWWGRELPDETSWDITTSVSYLFDFVRDLNSATWIIPNYSPWWEPIWDDDPITAFFVNRDDFYIWKRNSVHKAKIQINKTWDIYESAYLDSTKYTNTWVKNQEVVQDVNDSTFYYDWVKINRLKDEISNSEYDIFLSRPIQSFLKCLPEKQDHATSVFSYPYYKLFLRTDPNSSTNDIWIVFNVEEQSFSIQDNVFVDHSWTGYDRQNNNWRGFWQGYFDNRIIKDWISETWDWSPREFEYIWPWLDFWDSVRSKDLKDIHYQITASEDINIEHWTNVFKQDPSNWCITESSCNYRCLKWCDEKKVTKAKWTGNYWGYSYWGFTNKSCEDMMTKVLRFPTRIQGQYFQERLLWKWTWWFSLEYIDFLYNLNRR